MFMRIYRAFLNHCQFWVDTYGRRAVLYTVCVLWALASMVPVYQFAIPASNGLHAQNMDDWERASLFHRDTTDPVVAEIGVISPRTAGRFEVQAVFPRRNISVRGLLVVPAGIAGEAPERPVIVFLHGGENNPEYYHSNIEFMVQRATRYRFVLLSMQNYWAVGERLHPDMSVAQLMYHSARAAAAILEELIAGGIIQRGRIFSVGHSSGGFTAVAAAIMRPDLFDGFGANKANFYEADLAEIVTVGEELYYHRLRNDLSVRSVRILRATSTLGGASEAERVKHQTPHLRAYVQNILGIDLKTRDYPSEGH
ncbi:MAG: prolyl oligopeptidase family serine peptidase, partial [Leptospiraceae bacterium]|nr:prolyl oligopeptidase family serine peptidase [Leptospiraceae bacterium]